MKVLIRKSSFRPMPSFRPQVMCSAHQSVSAHAKLRCLDESCQLGLGAARKRGASPNWARKVGRTPAGPLVYRKEMAGRCGMDSLQGSGSQQWQPAMLSANTRSIESVRVCLNVKGLGFGDGRPFTSFNPHSNFVAYPILKASRIWKSCRLFHEHVKSSWMTTAQKAPFSPGEKEPQISFEPPFGVSINSPLESLRGV